MNCSETQSALSELVDGTLARDARHGVEAHLETCADCRAVLADLRRIRETAKALPKMAPPEALWQKVRADFERQAGRRPHEATSEPYQAASVSHQAASVLHQAAHLPGPADAERKAEVAKQESTSESQPGVPRQAGRLPHEEAGRLPHGEAGRLPQEEAGRLPHKEAGSLPDGSGQPASAPRQGGRVLGFPSRRALLAGLAAAAVLVIATSAGLYYATRPAAPVPEVPATAAHAEPAQSVQSIEAELQLAVQHYQNAINGLEKQASEGQAVLGPDTAAVLAKNNAILDQAVNESQAALRSQPTSEVARATLFEALQRKVTLLRDTIALINEMRKGDQAGTARVVGSLGKS